MDNTTFLNETSLNETYLNVPSETSINMTSETSLNVTIETILNMTLATYTEVDNSTIWTTPVTTVTQTVDLVNTTNVLLDNISDTVTNFTNITSSHLANDNIEDCNDWVAAQHAIFQLANLCMLISFLTPSNFRHHFFFLRLMLNFGYLLVVIWGAMFVCMLDILAWNAAFLFVNSVHLAYLCYSVVPDRFSKTLEDIYSHTFKPLRITRNQFRSIAEFGSILLLAKGAVYAKQGQNKTGQRLTILLKGRLTVTFDDIYLHTIEVNQFVDSPEFDSVRETGKEDTFQVTISASEDCLLFSWPYAHLIEHLSTNPVLHHKFNQIIGKDISQKLYEIQERLMACPNFMDGIGTRRSSMVNVRHSIVSSSETNLPKLNCLQGCMVNSDHPNNLSSNETYETSV